MKYRIVSDIHSEFWAENPMKAVRIMEKILPPLDTDATSTLLLAGDTGSYKRRNIYAAIIAHLCTRFAKILDIPGNHYWYGTDFGIERSEQVHYAGDGKYSFGSGFSCGGNTGAVHCATLWTNFNNENPMDMLLCQHGMNDYRQIPVHTPEKVLQQHKYEVELLCNIVRPGDIVMTHHAPSYQSVTKKYKTTEPYASINSGYASDLEWLIENLQPALWVHGHIHTPSDYMIGKTRVICNPVGYIGESNPVKNVVVEA